MTEIVTPPLEQQLSSLMLTAEERKSLFNSVVIAAKYYQRRDVPENQSTIPLFRKLNLEIFFLKFIEGNTDLVNTHGHKREFSMFSGPQKVTVPTFMILTNGLAVKGYINYNPATPDVNVADVAFYSCLENGVETLRGVPLKEVVLINTHVAEDVLNAIELYEVTHIDGVTDALVLDDNRTRSEILRQTHARQKAVKFPMQNVSRTP